MKAKHLSAHRSAIGTAGLLLAGLLTSVRAQTLPLTYTFDYNAPSWTSLWYGPSSTVHWDHSLDANNNLNSGSVRCEAPMNGTDNGCWGCVDNGWTWDQNVVIDNSNGKAASLSCDIRVDPSTPLTKDGDYGWWHLQLFDNVTWSVTDLGNVWMPPTATNWTHISLPITAGSPQHFFAYVITIWGGSYTNSLAFNMDNLTLAGPAVPAPQLLSPSLANGTFQFGVTNLVVGTTYIIQASTNLLDWSEVSRFSASDTGLSIGDNPPAGVAQQFYRLVTQ